jgi:peptidylprolyl isomerase
VKQGDTVRVRYRANLEDGTVVDSQHETEPFEFTVGEQIVIPGFERAVLGMCEGEVAHVRIPPEDAYGDYVRDRVMVVQRAKLASVIEPRVGMMIRVGPDEAAAQNVTITEVTNDTVTLDGNHRLAGKVVSFEIHLLQVNPT